MMRHNGTNGDACIRARTLEMSRDCIIRTRLLLVEYRLLEAQASTRGPLGEVLVWAVENLDKDLSVENLALHAAMSRRNFTRVFTAELGKSPAHYVEQLRIEAARQLLEDSWENLEEIASACGFSSAELMRRAFLRSIGITPSEYRERFRLAGSTPARSPVQFSSRTAEAGTAA
jgi:transcriptional regulator GlxA family with amidase domain